MEANQQLQGKINSFRRKFFLTKVSKGGLAWAILFSLVLLVLLGLESLFWMSPTLKGLLFFSYLLSSLYFFSLWVGIPLVRWWGLYRPLRNNEAARLVGRQNPHVRDKLINTLQLLESSPKGNALVGAAINQRSSELMGINFEENLSWGEQKRLSLYFSIPLSIVVFLIFFSPEFITHPGARLINFHKEYFPPAPFKFDMSEIPGYGFRNEEIPIVLGFSGEVLPKSVFIWVDGNKRKMAKIGLDSYRTSIPRAQADMSIRFEAEGFFSNSRTINIYDRPTASETSIVANFPEYTGWADRSFSSMGSFRVPIGTKLSWAFQTIYADRLSVLGDSGVILSEIQTAENTANFTSEFLASAELEFVLSNQYGKNREPLVNRVEIIEDRMPMVNLRSIADTSLYRFVVLGGEIADDYGFTRLRVAYRVRSEDGTVKGSGAESISFSPSIPDQEYYLHWDIEPLGLAAGEKLEYFVEVSDNDGVKGPKTSRSSIMVLGVPNKKEIVDQLNQRKQEFVKSGASTKNSYQELQKELKEFQDETKNKKELDWQDKKRLEDLLEKHKDLEKDIEDLKEELSKIRPQEEKYLDQKEEVQEKSRQLEQLMEEVLDEKTKKLLRELQSLLEKQADNDMIQKKLSELERKDSQYEKELDRAIELFKQLQFDQKLDQAINDLEELAEEQENLSEETKDGSMSKEELSENQQDINDKFEQLKEDMKELGQMDQDMENPRNIEEEGFEESMEELKEEMEESKEMLDSGQKNKAGKSQKSNSQKMKDMAQSMKEFQESAEMEMLAEDINNLRALLENLITMSFEQERIMTEFRKVHRTDPRYTELSQEQLELQNDAQKVEDSLYALASRLFQIESFVTKEMGEMNYQMDESIRLIRERRPGKATIRQQFVMTSVNNLALMLDNVLEQLQEQMANQMQGDQMCSKPNGNKPSPSLSQMQKQLNQKIRDLKKGGAQGQELSEQLLKLAQEQEQIREQMQQMGEGGNQIDKDLKKQLDDLAGLMEDTERDLVHKRLTRKLLERQEEIETRLLESEKADRERELKEEREGELAQEQERRVPPEIEDYIRSKESQIELLKTISPELNPYFKEKVNQYFERINSEPNQGQR